MLVEPLDIDNPGTLEACGPRKFRPEEIAVATIRRLHLRLEPRQLK